MNAMGIFITTVCATGALTASAMSDLNRGPMPSWYREPPPPGSCISLMRALEDIETSPLPRRMSGYQDYLVGPPIVVPKKKGDGGMPPLRDQGRNPAIDLSISRAQVRSFRLRGNHQFLQETFFVIPSNDGEAVRAIEILRAAGAPMVAAMKVEWGTKLEKFFTRAPSFFNYFRDYHSIQGRKAKRIVLFELPAPELENSLRSEGYEVVIVDHHNYAELKDNRYRAESSLEQIMQLIGWQPSRADMAIAINDRGYIPGMRAFGLTDEEIREVRLNDHLAQGKPRSQILFDRERVEEFIPLLRKVRGFFVLESMNREIDSALLKEEINIRSPGVVDIFEFSGKRIGFSGSPAVIKALKAIDYQALGYDSADVVVYGGGSEAGSMFFGFKPQNPPKGAGDLLPYYVKTHFLEIAERALVDHTGSWGF